VCGLLGIIGGERLAPDLASKIGSLLHHRGPDDTGQWKDSDLNVLLAHNRLAVQYLSEAGQLVTKTMHYLHSSVLSLVLGSAFL